MIIASIMGICVGGKRMMTASEHRFSLWVKYKEPFHNGQNLGSCIFFSCTACRATGLGNSEQECSCVCERSSKYSWGNTITSLFLKLEKGASHPRNAKDPSAIISELIGDEVMTLFDLTFFKEEGDKLVYCAKFEARWFCKGP